MALSSVPSFNRLFQRRIDSRRKDFTDFAFQTNRNAFFMVVISRSAINDNVGNAASRGDEWK